MASPVGHGFVGLCVARGATGAPVGRRAGLYLLAAFAALAPDLDFLPGLLQGSPNLYHQSVSHSLGAAVAFAGVTVLVARVRRSPAASTAGRVAGVSYASHLLLDLLGRDARPPVGQPLLWPFSGEHVAPVWPVLPSIAHASSGDSAADFFDALFTPGNLAAVGVEAALLVPPCLALVWWIRHRGRAAST